MPHVADQSTASLLSLSDPRSKHWTGNPIGSTASLDDPWRRRYADEAYLSIPKLLILVDRNPYSKTYGSFDRSYWHYRTMDFPCGMSQEFCLPLAIVHKQAMPGNPWHGNQRVRELALAAVDFAARSAHADGSCDDYFPYEQALGAAVFSLYAMSETCLTLDDRDPDRVAFLARRADHLLNYQETGRLTNHQALYALALYNVFMITGETRFRKGAEQRVELCREWQNQQEGWFQEYEGADPGYHSCTIDFLAKLWQKSKDEKIIDMLLPAVKFAWHFMHPDGSYAGEYGSRNTYHFYPHGFEVMARFSAEAAQVCDHFLRTLPNRKRYYNDDDRMCAHYVYNWLQAWRDYWPERPAPITGRKPFRKVFPAAKMAVVHTPHYYAIANFSKGGVFKVYDATRCVASDTGIIVRENDAKGRVLVAHLVDEEHKSSVAPDASSGECSGRLSIRKTMLATPLKQIVFRFINLSVGRFHPNLLRAMLQKKLIVGKPRTDWTFERRIEFGESKIVVRDRLTRPTGAPRLRTAHAGSDATSIYVANSNVYQESVLLPWRDLGSAFLDTLHNKGEAVVEHTLDLSDRTTTPSAE